ncbi:hypothetical protein B5G15_03410 [Faecalitalea cylindroides]|nr:hypothetical protein B5G15_03410 [Faecalitalea cylindroides]
MYMKEIVENLIKTLPSSPIVLNKKNIDKIHATIPVPSEYKVLWADISSFGGYPAGVVISDNALIVKAAKYEVKNNARVISEENKKKDKNNRIKPPKVIYQIIPWEYYSPEDYEIKVVEGKKGDKRYVFKAGNTELAHFSDKGLYTMLTAYKKKIVEEREAAEATFSAINTINTENVMFNAAYGADQMKTGHGIYAEEAGTILDKLSGESATVVGRDNAKNGPDKIVGSSPIQCKYYKQAYGSVNACFKKDPVTGLKLFRYYDLNGDPMKIEVPADQYTQAVELMKNKISDGQVPGINDPNAAYSIIRKGKLTYTQALNLAKAGTIESITFDVVTGAVNCLSALGISSIVAFAQTYWVTKDYKKATKSALFIGLQVYGMAFAGGVIASQLSRTGIASALNPLINEVGKKMTPQMVQEIVNSFRALAGKKAIYGAAAQKSFTKFLGSTAITQGIMFIVFSVPDTYKVLNKKMSGAQYFKNMTSLLASFGGTAAASMLTGLLIGKKFGEKINKKAGAAIGMGVGAIGGTVCGTVVKGISNIFHEDDAVITARLFNAVMFNIFMDNMLMADEQEKLIEILNTDDKGLRELQINLRTSKTQEQDIRDYLLPKINLIVMNRERIDEMETERLDEEVKSIFMKGELAYEM